MMRSLALTASSSCTSRRLAIATVIRFASSSAAGVPDDALLHRCPVDTEFFQSSLLTLKVPDLNMTVSKYLKSQRPMLDDQAYAETSRICQEFLSKDGPELQRILLEYNKENSDGNYVSGLWFDMYLRDRRSVVLNHTPFMAFAGAPKPIDTLDRLTNMIYSSARYYLSYTNRVLRPEVFFMNPKLTEDEFYRRMKLLSRIPGHSRIACPIAYLHKAYPLDMSQYPNLMGSTRLPQPVRDTLRRYPDSRHVVLLRGGRFYSFDLLTPDGKGIVSPEEVKSRLVSVLSDPRPPAEHPVGVLTSADRDSWTEERRHLASASRDNATSLEAIDSALFLVCLDEAKPTGDVGMCHAFLHSGEGANRWWDKSLSLLASLPSGEFAVSFEHSWGDGVAVARYFNEIFNDSNRRPGLASSSGVAAAPAGSPSVRRLEFDLDDRLKSAIATARSRLSARTSDLDLDFGKFEGLGKAAAKRAGLSPDSVSQLAIQLAYYWLSGGKTAATYESCSTAAFRRGRTETIRSATSETKAFCQLADSGSASPSDLRAAMKAASDAHGALTKDAAMGKGWDRHLFALRCMAERRPGGLDSAPALFRDPGYRRITEIVLSTSTLSSPAIKIGGFGPVSPAGFGVGYAIEEAAMGCVVTAYKSGGRSAGQFMENYRRACNYIADAIGK